MTLQTSRIADPSVFQLVSEMQPKGDQPQAIESLTRACLAGARRQTLLGITGSGKTYTMAQVIANLGRPALVLAHNKILAAQLYSEFRELFPNNAVEYFVSYYDYYQPEAYVARTDTYIEKDSSINQQIERMRNSATRSLLARRDVIIVASVSCIYGLGSPENYEGMSVELRVGEEYQRDELLRQFARIQYQRTHGEFRQGTFRVRGDVVEIFPVYEEDRIIRLEFFDTELEAIAEVDPLRGVVHQTLDEVTVYPGSHYITPEERLERATASIEEELDEMLLQLRGKQKLLEAQRLEQRTRFDLEMLRETGTCSGIENYSRHLDGRQEGEPPAVLINYFPEDLLVLIDESHQTLPQLGGMYRGDRARKESLVQHGFRLRSALDNRPLQFEEFEDLVPQAIFVSATPGPLEKEQTSGDPVEMIIRPTGLLDPVLEVRPVDGQVDDLLSEIRERAQRGERVLVTTLTKRMAEELTDYYADLDVKVRYMHSDIDALERAQIIQDLRLGTFDVLVGINLLREGLDLPEVSLVAILDADKEGFLRSTTSLIQTFGRAARHLQGQVIMYADSVTDSMKLAMDETERRRSLQQDYNEEHGIVPVSIRKKVREILDVPPEEETKPSKADPPSDPARIPQEVGRLRKEMYQAAEDLEFERAAVLRDRIRELEMMEMKYR